MSSLNAVLIVIGILICLGGPILWWIFFRMDEQPSFLKEVDLPIAPLSISDVKSIEASLGIVLPESYSQFLISVRSPDIDGQTLFGDAELITSFTTEYREGFAGLPPWPKHLVYIGDAADACPCVINTNSGEVLRLDKGNINRKPIERFESFLAFLASTVFPTSSASTPPELPGDILCDARPNKAQ